jgi:histidine triad (HIT) family protein
VFHVHLHVFPRFRGDGFGLRHGPSFANLPPREELEAVARELRTSLKDRRPTSRSN